MISCQCTPSLILRSHGVVPHCGHGYSFTARAISSDAASETKKTLPHSRHWSFQVPVAYTFQFYRTTLPCSRFAATSIGEEVTGGRPKKKRAEEQAPHPSQDAKEAAALPP
jgi:hypothetical protein